MSVSIGLAAFLLTQSQPVDPLAPQSDAQEPSEATPAITSPPSAPMPVVVVPRDWRGVFDAIRAGQWGAAQAGIATLPSSPLTAVAKAEFFTARGSPNVELAPLLSLLAEAPDLPKADQLQRLAATRGQTLLPGITPRYGLIPLASSPRRGRPRPVTGDLEADRLRTDMDALIKADDAPAAELLLAERLPLLTLDARLEAAHRVAWIYYVRGDDGNARRVADSARIGAFGEWSAHLAWVSGLAAWRQNDCRSSAPLFRQVAQGVYDQSTQAAGWYWAARAEMACRRPEAVNGLLRNAARLNETFYGMVARRTLGIDVKFAPLPAVATGRIEQLPNVRRAAELMNIGERDLAGQYLRFQARIGNPADHLALVQLASRWELSATQHYLAHFGRPGVQLPAAARYPRPSWSPRQGWRIDPALGLAHALQESSFRAEAVSPAGAVGLMQVLPGTMNLLARTGGVATGDLRDPATNMEFGQRWIELMRTNPYTQGQLPKIIASYNAGPQPVGRWQVNDRGDPLLWMESVPYWETRYYVPTVLRNMWVYQGFNGAPTPTLTQMAQHRWPAFPTARGR
jgi:soluble lytic murein transglycosylase-like protein